MINKRRENIGKELFKGALTRQFTGNTNSRRQTRRFTKDFSHFDNSRVREEKKLEIPLQIMHKINQKTTYSSRKLNSCLSNTSFQIRSVELTNRLRCIESENCSNDLLGLNSLEFLGNDEFAEEMWSRTKSIPIIHLKNRLMRRIELSSGEKIYALIRTVDLIFPMKFQIENKLCSSIILVGYDHLPKDSKFDLRFTNVSEFFIHEGSSKLRTIALLIEASTYINTMIGCAFKGENRQSVSRRPGTISTRNTRNGNKILREGIQYNKFNDFLDRALNKTTRTISSKRDKILFNRDLMDVGDYKFLRDVELHASRKINLQRMEDAKQKRDNIEKDKNENIKSKINRNSHYKKLRFLDYCEKLEEASNTAFYTIWIKLMKLLVTIHNLRIAIDLKLQSRKNRFKIVRISGILHNFLVPLAKTKKSKQIAQFINAKIGFTVLIGLTNIKARAKQAAYKSLIYMSKTLRLRNYLVNFILDSNSFLTNSKLNQEQIKTTHAT